MPESNIISYVIEDQIDKRLLSPKAYPLIFDRIEMLRGPPQWYGTQYLLDDKNVRYQIFDQENVNKRRVKYALQPIDEYK